MVRPTNRVGCSKILFGFDIVDNLRDKEIDEMKKDKIGKSYHYLDAFIPMLRYAKAWSSSALTNRRYY